MLARHKDRRQRRTVPTPVAARSPGFRLTLELFEHRIIQVWPDFGRPARSASGRMVAIRQSSGTGV
ncbi:hypothetical protein Ga0074812_102407 [Parafrankia irregularis]|uniref:Uncharacterized protein n=1 Tax=Parafrankia irregularis TaxID=795642 RepID=A0A0S4QG01_9ACTN|nr:hypothetical protein Ga0074812_102407 [Parafrankia irregularis]